VYICKQIKYHTSTILIITFLFITVLCQEETLHISCANGTFISFLDANFGRLSDEPCPHILGLENQNCYFKKETLNVLNDRCGDKINCDVYVSKDVFGSPCFAITKYLDVTYSCEPTDCNGMYKYSIINRRFEYQNKTTSDRSTHKN
jgi:hypothetical protein